MAQQVGSGAAPAASETEPAPGGASGMTQAGPRQNGTKAGRADAGQGAEAGGRPGDIKASRVRGWLRRNPQRAITVTQTQAPNVLAAGPELDLASNDPLVGYLLSAASAVDITSLQLESPALASLKQAGVVLVVPLISSGSLVGMLSLGPRRSYIPPRIQVKIAADRVPTPPTMARASAPPSGNLSLVTPSMVGQK